MGTLKRGVHLGRLPLSLGPRDSPFFRCNNGFSLDPVTRASRLPTAPFLSWDDNFSLFSLISLEMLKIYKMLKVITEVTNRTLHRWTEMKLVFPPSYPFPAHCPHSRPSPLQPVLGCRSWCQIPSQPSPAGTDRDFLFNPPFLFHFSFLQKGSY